MELKIARSIARLTQRQLGELVGVDDSLISSVETGRNDLGAMRYDSVVRIARVLAPGVPVEKLFPVLDYEPPPGAKPASEATPS